MYESTSLVFYILLEGFFLCHGILMQILLEFISIIKDIIVSVPKIRHFFSIWKQVFKNPSKELIFLY